VVDFFSSYQICGFDENLGFHFLSNVANFFQFKQTMSLDLNKVLQIHKPFSF
jgi:hypothetical protein